MLKQVANKLELNLLVEDINYFLRPQQRKVRLLFLLASKVSDVTGSIEFGFQTIEVSGSSQQGFASSWGVNENNYNYQNEERNANVDREVQTSSFVSNGASSSSLLLKNSNSSSSVKSIVSKNIVKKSITGSSLKKNQQVIPQTGENSSLIAIGGIILLLTFETFLFWNQK